MPTLTSIIDTVTTPPLSSLQQVLDKNGPFHAGDHTISSFVTDGAFLLPAGTYSIFNTNGVLVIPNGAIPAAAGFKVGWNDAGFPTISGDEYYDRIAQLCKIHTLPITGASIIVQTFDVNLVTQLFLWPALFGGPAKIGLHVEPNWSVDLFWMCIL